jgi:PAS domain S-box-containing protein
MIANITDPAALEAAIANCALEPIHTPGATQSFGAAIVVDVAGGITHVSSSVQRLFGVAPGALLGAGVRDVFSGGLAPAWLRASAATPDDVVHLQALVLGQAVDVAGWLRPDGVVVLSLVPRAGNAPDSLVEDFADLQRDLGETSSLEMLCDRSVHLLAKISGYDRVMIYKFDHDDTGIVVSEARREEMEPYLGLHYPASDIPAQARALYVRNRTRVLADAMAAADPLVSASATLAPVDLSLSLLRAHSPVHVQYVLNMGLRATLVVSIVTTGGRLWGLLACSHLAPRVPTTHVRLLSDLVGQILAVRIELQEESDRRRADAQATAKQHDMVHLLSSAGTEWAEAIAAPLAVPRLTEVVESAGAASVSEGVVRTVGETPPAAVILALCADLEARRVHEMFHASSVRQAPLLAAYAEVASGVLAVRLRVDNSAWLLWFRPGRVQRVTWAGKPQKTVVVEQGVARLSPRQSFAAWTEEQAGRAQPWSLLDLANARRVRESTIDVLLRLYERTALNAQSELARALQSFEQMVGGITDYAIIQLDRGGLVKSWNLGAQTIHGYGADEVIGKPFSVFYTRAELARAEEHLRMAAEQGRQEEEGWRVRRDGSRIWASVVITAVRSPGSGELLGFVKVTSDLSARKRAEDAMSALLAERTALLQEVHHRVKNNLQMIMSLLNIQSHEIEDDRARAVFLEARDRVHSIALLHESLYQSADLGRVDMREYVSKLVVALEPMFEDATTSPRIVQRVADVHFSVDTALPCGLIIHELIMNALKHAFAAIPAATSGEITVDLAQTAADVTLTVADNGAGFARVLDPSIGGSLGLTLIRDLASQLGGSVAFVNVNGARCTVTFPRPPARSSLPPPAGPFTSEVGEAGRPSPPR